MALTPEQAQHAREKQEKLEQFDRDVAQLLITLECCAGEGHWTTIFTRNVMKRIRKTLTIWIL